MNELRFDGRVAVVTGRGARASGAPTRACSPSAGAQRRRQRPRRLDGRHGRRRRAGGGGRRRDRRPPAARPSPTRATWPPRTAARRSSTRAVEQLRAHRRRSSTTPGSCGGRGFPDVDREDLERPPRRARRRLVQHGAGRVAAPRRAGLRPHRDDDVDRDARAARQHRLRHGQGRRHRPGPQPRRRRRGARHQGQPASRRPRPRAWPRAASGPELPPDARRADGRLPRPRGLPGQRRDLHRRRRPLRPPVHRVDPGLRRTTGAAPTIEDVAAALGRRSTTRPATPSPPTSWTGPGRFLSHLDPG